MISHLDSTKLPEKLEEGFVDDPRAERDIDSLGKIDRKPTYIFKRWRSYDHSDEINPYHERHKKGR